MTAKALPALEGSWWLPHSPEHRRHGTATFDDDGWRLVVRGGLDGVANESSAGASAGDLVSDVTIHGHVLDGRDVSLFGAVGLAVRGWPAEPTQETWRLQSFATGHMHVRPDEALWKYAFGLAHCSSGPPAQDSRSLDWARARSRSPHDPTSRRVQWLTMLPSRFESGTSSPPRDPRACLPRGNAHPASASRQAGAERHTAHLLRSDGRALEHPTATLAA